MKRFFVTLLFATLLPNYELFAQVTIDNVATNDDTVAFESNMNKTDVSVDVETEAMRHAERLMQRKERNTVDFTANLHGSLTAFSDSWAASGDNTISLLANINFGHTYKKDRFTLTNTVAAKFGYNNMKIELQGEQQPVWFKNVDELSLSTSPQWTMVKNWTYGATVKFRTQFAPGYEARGDKQNGVGRVSNFLTPGYLDASVGFTYIVPTDKFPLKINLAPLAMSTTYRNDLEVSKDYGVLEGKKSKYEGGLSVQLDFDKTWGKNGWLRYRTTAYSFYGWITALSTKKLGETLPTLRWENTFDIKATKYISTQIYVQLYYNNAESKELQLQGMLSVGLTYTFKNK
ncbi:MAG: DUF3078 domain-containing protein [Alistipes sp.]|nr:DUF3078 domain-containing protein [Alistipes sp.]MBO7307657.1 DUF3078 domain-containing protein [Alistipes sp.]